MDLHTPGLVTHLWRVTLDKLAVDQPGYDSYRRVRAADADPTRQGHLSMDFDLPADLQAYLRELDDFIDDEIGPLQAARRQPALLRPPPRMGAHRLRQRRPAAARMGSAAASRCRRAGRRGRPPALCLPRAYGGQDGSNLWMAVIREHLAAKGLGLHNDLQTEHSIVGNIPFVLMLRDFGTPGAAKRIHRPACSTSATASPSA